MPELETELPSIRKIQSLIKDKQEVEVKLLTNDLLAGKLFWQDTICVCIIDSQEQQTMIWKQAIAYIKPKG